jgi:lipopolysaccharide export system protein LptA
LRRLHGEKVDDVVTGNIIQYNSLTDVFTVDGGAEKNGGRVRATLTPRKEAAQDRAGVPVPLRPDDTLDRSRK